MYIDFQEEIKLENLHPKTIFEEKVVAFLSEWFSDSETVKVQTSGSTGTPKIFEIEKEKMRASAEMTCNFLNLKPGNSALLCLPVEYISGKMLVVRSIERKLKLHIENSSTKPLENITEEIDFCAMTPLQVENSLDKIHLIKKLIIGGAAVSESLKKKLKTSNFQLPTSSIYETYGMSETLSHIALKEIFPNEEEFFNVFDGINISLDERNCLKINAPKLNSEILQTNDLVEINTLEENGKQQFKFLGRIDNVINSGGAKIFPEKLEALVKKHLSNEVVFLGIPDEVFGQKLILVIEENQESRIENQEHLKSIISNLEFEKSFHQPKEIIFLKEIPRTPNGKVNRKELLKLILSDF